MTFHFPLGKIMKVGHAWLRVIGVLEKRDVVVSSSSAGLGISNTNDQVFIPSKTMLVRYMNRAIVNKKLPQATGMRIFGGGRGHRGRDHQSVRRSCKRRENIRLRRGRQRKLPSPASSGVCLRSYGP